MQTGERALQAAGCFDAVYYQLVEETAGNDNRVIAFVENHRAARGQKKVAQVAEKIQNDPACQKALAHQGRLAQAIERDRHVDVRNECSVEEAKKLDPARRQIGFELKRRIGSQ